jgi:hypothetical protein
MRKLFSLLISTILVATTLVAITSTQASAAPTLTTCTNLETGKTLVLRSADAKCRSHLGSALWVQEQSDGQSRTGTGFATITVCSSKNSLSSYRFIKDSCPKFQVTTSYWRAIATPATPIIEAASARGHDSAALVIRLEKSAISAPITHYLVTDTKSGQIRKVLPGNLGRLNIPGLFSESTYSFTIAAVNVDGISAASLSTPAIRTGAAPVVASTSQVALTCATGGTCVVGDTGPGGGKVFYVATTSFTCGPTRASTCNYLEAAPSGWNTGSDPQRTWAKTSESVTAVNNPTSPQTATATAIGWGYRNTRAIILQGNTDTATSAAALADSYAVTVSGVLIDDWYLPSVDELNQMCKWQRGITGTALTNLTTVCVGGTSNSGLGAAGFVGNTYWASSEAGTNVAWYQYFNIIDDQLLSYKNSPHSIRPVRAF